ncbi:unnamed protein product [Onchocerca flexuosa]|uniref:Transposase n=1 Tax=Onchocerca flexuosa TaxID=387005 RepID=A0A183HMC3_9BILA|nr:unnamed protein product [Onchocerca flexuosa]
MPSWPQHLCYATTFPENQKMNELQPSQSKKQTKSLSIHLIYLKTRVYSNAMRYGNFKSMDEELETLQEVHAINAESRHGE